MPNRPKLRTTVNSGRKNTIFEWDVKPSGNAENIRCLTCKDNDGRLLMLKFKKIFFVKN